MLRAFALAKRQISRAFDPLVMTQAHGMDVRLARIEGEFVWHRHDDADETFILIEGSFAIAFRDRIIALAPGDLLTVPRGMEHQPFSSGVAWVYVIEPTQVINTGNTPSELTRTALRHYAPAAPLPDPPRDPS
ncbi:MAG: hypothetical protein RLZZ127_108 [Planctomycetota bacterium]|jgi:mannose-6-phosphate isomerase-like protein (cupin superfamily)